MPSGHGRGACYDPVLVAVTGELFLSGAEASVEVERFLVGEFAEPVGAGNRECRMTRPPGCVK